MKSLCAMTYLCRALPQPEPVPGTRKIAPEPNIGATPHRLAEPSLRRRLIERTASRQLDLREPPAVDQMNLQWVPGLSHRLRRLLLHDDRRGCTTTCGRG